MYENSFYWGRVTGGHFYPIIAVAEAINDATRDRKLLEPQLYYAAPDPYDRELLVANNITFVPTAAGKMRRYFSLLNFFDLFKTAWGVMRSLLRVFFFYPDVVFATGGYASFPTLLAARLFRIPVVIYATDVEPSRVNRWAKKFAVKIAVSFPEAAKYFPPEKTAFTGNPIRKAALMPAREGATRVS
jgi:UDP-N-acetylglucosamine--N-acetylmuramyl-(pentapeptide) pyrophosphoryl-undecaprenol N-acetylglucosamine transferase